MLRITKKCSGLRSRARLDRRGNSLSLLELDRLNARKELHHNSFLSWHTKPTQTPLPPTLSPALYSYPSYIATAQSFPLSCLLELLAIELYVHRLTESSRTMLVSLLIQSYHGTLKSGSSRMYAVYGQELSLAKTRGKARKT